MPITLKSPPLLISIIHALLLRQKKRATPSTMRVSIYICTLVKRTVPAFLCPGKDTD